MESVSKTYFSSEKESIQVFKLKSALHQPWLDRLVDSKNVLISGCGGGYDFFSGLPLLFALREAGLNVYLGNLTFTYDTGSMRDVTAISDICFEISATSSRSTTDWSPEEEYYWPELWVSRWFKTKENIDFPVYLFERSGVRQLKEAYQKLIDKHNIDTVILVDGGTDSLCFGNEQGLGTPTEDMSSICALNMLKVPTKLLICLGFGVDSFHGVCHSHFLENVSTLIKQDGFLGSFSLTSQMVEAQKMKDIYLASKPTNSVVCASVVSALEGNFGNYHAPWTKNRTQGSKLYISPLMSMYWCFDLEKVASNVLYLDLLKDTESSSQIRKIIHDYCSRYFSKGKYVGPRPTTQIPY